MIICMWYRHICCYYNFLLQLIKTRNSSIVTFVLIIVASEAPISIKYALYADEKGNWRVQCVSEGEVCIKVLFISDIDNKYDNNSSNTQLQGLTE